MITFQSVKQKIVTNQFQQEEEDLFSYFSLSQHPLNDFRPIMLDKEQILFNKKKQIVFSDLNIPLCVIYDHLTANHCFYLMEFNYEEIQKQQEEIDFENIIEIIELQKEEFQEKAFSVQPFINLKKIFQDEEMQKKALKIVLVENSFNNSKSFKKSFLFYMLTNGMEDNVNSLKIYQIEFNLKIGKKKNYYMIEKMEKLNVIQGIKNIWGIDYFQCDNKLFKNKNYFNHSFKENNPNFLSFMENEEQITFNKIKFDKLFYEYINKKCLKEFFQKKYKFNALLILKENFGLFLLSEQTFLFEIKIPKNFFNDLNQQKNFEQFEIIEVINQKIIFQQNESQRKIELPVPQFKENLFNLIFQIAQEIFDKQTFWQIIANLFKNNSEINFEKGTSNFPFLVNSETEMIVTFFAFILVFNNMKKIGKNNILSLFSTSLESDMQKINFLQNKIFLQDQTNYFQLALNNFRTNEDFQDVIEIFSQKFPIENQISETKTQKDTQIFPHISFNLNDFNVFKIKFFKYLHHCNEDFKLIHHNRKTHEDLTFFLFIYSLFLNEEKSDKYSEYYLKLQPEVMNKFSSSKILKDLLKICQKEKGYYQQTKISTEGIINDQKEYFNENLSENVFDIYEFLSNIFTCHNQAIIQKRLQVFPFFYTHSYNIMKILALILKLEFRNKKFKKENIIENINEKTTEKYILVQKQFFKKLDSFSFLLKRKQEFLIQKSKKKDFSYKLFDKIFYFFIKNKINLQYIESQIDSLEYVYKIFLRLTRKKISFFLKNPFLPKSAYELLDREDLYLNRIIQPDHHSFRLISYQTMISRNFSQIKEKSVSFLQNKDESQINNNRLEDTSLLQNPLNKIDDQEENKQREIISSTKYGLSEVIKGIICKNLHYSKDDILFREIYKIFDSTEFIFLSPKSTTKIIDQNNLSEEEKTIQLQELIFKPISQKLSFFVGRGALDYNSEETSLTEVIKIPEINLTGKVKEKPMLINYVFNHENPEDLSAINWAHFHNGVATGLKISKQALENLDKESLRTWIDYQGNEYNRYDHAGLLFGLGLQGHFNCFTIADIYFNLRACNDARIIATILGLATSKMPRQRVHMDDTVIKAFNLHLEFNYNSNTDVQISRIVQSAAMVGIGIYLKGMAKKSNSEIMLNQIEANPINENNQGRECHSLAAGFALGLINLGKGSKVPSIRDINIDERLFLYIEGGDSLTQKEISEGLKSKQYKSCNVKEIEKVNTQLTAPSALIALTLIHLKKNNKIITRRLSLPNTIHEIINANPKHILLTVLAKNLIDWEEMEISQNFINSQIPQTVNFLQKGSLKQIEEKYFLNYNFPELDYHNLSLIYHNIVAGVFLSLSFKFAGTGNNTLKQLIIEYLQSLETIQLLEINFCTDFNSKEKLDEYSLFNIYSIVSLALGIVMAGRCDTESLKSLKKIKQLISKSNSSISQYGFHMAVHMSIGFLFLGNGAYTFGNNDFQIACLLLSVYPVFPQNFNDNTYHLQAFRHFYVLAIEENLFHLIDIDSHRPLKLRVELDSLTLKGKKKKEQKLTPLFYKTTDIWERLKVLNEDYHVMDFLFSQQSQEKPKFLFVKKKFVYEVNVKQLKNSLLSFNMDFLNWNYKQYIQSEYICKIFDQVIQKLNEDKKLNNNQREKIFKYYLHCFYNFIKKDKSSVISIGFKYFLNQFDYHSGIICSQMNSQQYFLDNGKLILDFHKFLELKKENKITTLEQLTPYWNESKENYLLKKKLETFEINKEKQMIKFLECFLKNDVKTFVFLQSNLNLSQIYQLEQFMFYLKLINLKNSENLKEIIQLLENKQLKNPMEIIKNLLTALEVQNQQKFIEWLSFINK